MSVPCWPPIECSAPPIPYTRPVIVCHRHVVRDAWSRGGANIQIHLRVKYLTGVPRRTTARRAHVGDRGRARTCATPDIYALTCPGVNALSSALRARARPGERATRRVRRRLDLLNRQRGMTSQHRVHEQSPVQQVATAPTAFSVYDGVNTEAEHVGEAARLGVGQA